MSDPAVAAQRQQARQQSWLASLITLPFRLFGVLCGSLLLCIAIECVGLHVFWPEEGWHHAQRMLDHELAQISEEFTRSALVQEPGHTANQIITRAYDLLLVRSGLTETLRDMSAQAQRQRQTRADAQPVTHDLRYYLGSLYIALQNDLIAAAYTVLVFLARLLVLALCAPLIGLAAFVGLIDGLVRRDVRRFGAGRESGFVYHRARAALMPLAVLPWLTYLALPVNLHPLWVLLPGAVLLGLAMNIAAMTFKKYL